MGSKASGKSDMVYRTEKVSLDALMGALDRSWGSKTSVDPQNWWPSNAAYGQCAVTALVVNDFFGGQFLRTMATYQNGNSTSHYYNELPDKSVVDLTRIQFPDGTKFSDPEYRSREYIVSNPSTVERYNLLKKRVSLRLENAAKEKLKLYFAHSTLDRKELRDKEIEMECRLGIELYNPFYDSPRNHIAEIDSGVRKPYSGIKDFNAIVDGDLEAIESCAGLLAVVPKNKPAIGESMEIFYNSFVLGRETYLIVEDEGFLGHPWLVKNSVARFKSTDEFMEWWESREHRLDTEKRNAH